MYNNVINLPEDAKQLDLVWLGHYLMPHDHRFTVFFYCVPAEPRNITTPDYLELIAQHLHWSWIGPVIEAGLDDELMWRETHYSEEYEADFLHHRKLHRVLKGGWVDLPQQPIHQPSVTDGSCYSDNVDYDEYYDEYYNLL